MHTRIFDYVEMRQHARARMLKNESNRSKTNAPLIDRARARRFATVCERARVLLLAAAARQTVRTRSLLTKSRANGAKKIKDARCCYSTQRVKRMCA